MACRLIYFDTRGRAEHIRFILAYTGMKYEDVRIPKEKWSELKKTIPFGTLPILEIGDDRISQSSAIARYLSNEYGLSGHSVWESAKCDSLSDTLIDLKQKIFHYRMQENTDAKEKERLELINNTIPYYCSQFNNIIKENNGFTVGDNITWTDFLFATFVEYAEQVFDKNILKEYTAIKGLQEKIYCIPSIAEWIKKRPVTEF